MLGDLLLDCLQLDVEQDAGHQQADADQWEELAKEAQHLVLDLS